MDRPLTRPAPAAPRRLLAITLALCAAALSGCAALPAHRMGPLEGSARPSMLAGSYRVEASWRVCDSTYLNPHALPGLLFGPATRRRLLVPATEPYRLLVTPAGAGLEFRLVSRSGEVAARRMVAVERGDDGHFYLDEVGTWGVPFLFGQVTHGRIRLSRDNIGGLVIEHGISVSGAVLLLGLLHVDLEHSTWRHLDRLTAADGHFEPPRRVAARGPDALPARCPPPRRAPRPRRPAPGSATESRAGSDI